MPTRKFNCHGLECKQSLLISWHISTFEMSTIGFWTDLEGHAGLWVGSFPALQPLLRVITHKLGISSTISSYTRSKTGRSNNQSGNKNLGGSNGDWAKSGPGKNGYIRNGSGIDADE